MGGYNFPFLFLAIVFVIVTVPLFIWSGLPKWLPFVLGLVVAVLGLLLIDAVLVLTERRKNRRYANPNRKPYSKEGQKKGRSSPQPLRKNDLNLPKAPEGLTCPSCGSSNIAIFLYGLPAMSEELEKALKPDSPSIFHPASHR